MKKLFPPMYEHPEWTQVLVGGFYWIVYLFLLPALLNLVWMAISPTDLVYAWICVAYYILNTLFVGWIFWSYLKDAFWEFRLNLKKCLASIGWGLLILAVLQIPLFLFGAQGDWTVYIREVSIFPVADTLFQVPPRDSMDFYPWLSAPFFVTLVPFVMGCLYLLVGFASACAKRGWTGYLVTAALVYVSCLFIHLYHQSLEDLWSTYGRTLPFYLCACWVFQRSDTVWSPILFYAITNLLGVGIYLIAG